MDEVEPHLPPINPLTTCLISDHKKALINSLHANCVDTMSVYSRHSSLTAARSKNAEVLSGFVQLCGECVPFGFVVVPPYNCKRVTTLLLSRSKQSWAAGAEAGAGAGVS